MKLPSILPTPERPSNLPINSKWLAGEGAGSWFFIQKEEDTFRISRYSPKGTMECEGNFKCNNNSFDPNADFTLGYPSHCGKVTVIQNTSTVTFLAQ